MAFETMEAALVNAAYTALGQTVTYTPQDADSSSVNMIVDNAAELFGFEAGTAEDIVRGRVKISDITKPRRYDCIEMADGTAYVVDSVERLNNTEWGLRLTERDR